MNYFNSKLMDDTDILGVPSTVEEQLHTIRNRERFSGVLEKCHRNPVPI